MNEPNVFTYLNIFKIEIDLLDLLCSHQNVSGYYRVSSYFFAKILCDILPIRLFPVIFYTTITYWMIGKCVCVCVYVCVRAFVCKDFVSFWRMEPVKWYALHCRF